MSLIANPTKCFLVEIIFIEWLADDKKCCPRVIFGIKARSIPL
jgi:hypothetical protein